MNGIQNEMNSINNSSPDLIKSEATAFQQKAYSIHQYPYVFVIEKQNEPVAEFTAPKNGTIWGPFFKAEEK